MICIFLLNFLAILSSCSLDYQMCVSLTSLIMCPALWSACKEKTFCIWLQDRYRRNKLWCILYDTHAGYSSRILSWSKLSDFTVSDTFMSKEVHTREFGRVMMRRKFGEHERNARVARSPAKSNCSCLVLPEHPKCIKAPWYTIEGMNELFCNSANGNKSLWRSESNFVHAMTVHHCPFMNVDHYFELLPKTTFYSFIFWTSHQNDFLFGFF